MKKWYYSIVIFTLFTNCQKAYDPDSTPGIDDTNELSGTWQLVSVNSKTQVSSESDFGGTTEKITRYSDYSSSKNTGLVTFNESTIAGAGIGYQISSALKSYSYENGSLKDSSVQPFNINVKPARLITGYELIGEDSIHFTNGAFITASVSSKRQQPAPGCTYTVNNNILTLTEFYNKDFVEEVSGFAYHIIESASTTITLKKQ